MPYAVLQCSCCRISLTVCDQSWCLVFFLSDSDLMVVKTHMTCVSKQVIPSFVVAVRHGVTPPFPCSPDHIHHLQTSDEFCCQFIILYTACIWSAPWPCCHIIIHAFLRRKVVTPQHIHLYPPLDVVPPSVSGFLVAMPAETIRA